ncbi:MAG: hypothetical protein HY587_04955 [Candidatus Omnitrophica bacterium]|nr:hypothetical protein [Candidatus Omnitrophota bacterium]
MKTSAYKPNILLSRRFGFSLAEVMLCVLLSSIMFLTVVASAQTGILSMRHTDVRVYLNDQLRQGIAAFAREIVQTSPATIVAHLNITTDPSNNSVVVFQIPVDADGINDWGGAARSDVVDNNTEYTQWGAHRSLGNEDSTEALLGQWMRYSVQQNAAISDPAQRNQLVRDILLADGATVDPASPSKVIASNITRFQVTKNQERLTATLGAESRDSTQGGGTPRILRDSYSKDLILRNDVF